MAGAAEPRTARRWLTGVAALLVLAAAAIAFGLISAIAGGDRAGESGPSGSAVVPPEEPSSNASRSEAAGRLWTAEGHRIARMRHRAKVSLHARPGGRVIERVGDRTEFGSRRTFSVLDRRGAWLEVVSEEIPTDRSAWIRADPDALRFLSTPWSIHAALGERVVELRRDGETMHSFEVTVGTAATATPIGRFAVTDLIVGGLNPVYGCCAIALTARQSDLPDGWIGGDRVAIHGSTGPLGEAASNGCLRASNEDARTLTELVPLGTPVFIEA